MKNKYKRILKIVLLSIFGFYVLFIMVPNYKILFESSGFVLSVILCFFGMSTAYSAPWEMDKEVYEDLPWLPNLYFGISFSLPFIVSVVVLWKHFLHK